MDFKTCEEYVLDKLKHTEDELYLVKKQCEELKSQNTKDEAYVEAIQNMVSGKLIGNEKINIVELFYNACGIEIIEKFNPQDNRKHVIIDLEM
jgi:hypothetical protein